MLSTAGVTVPEKNTITVLLGLTISWEPRMQEPDHGCQRSTASDEQKEGSHHVWVQTGFPTESLLPLRPGDQRPPLPQLWPLTPGLAAAYLKSFRSSLQHHHRKS